MKFLRKSKPDPDNEFFQSEIYAILTAAAECGFKAHIHEKHAKAILQEINRLKNLAKGK